MLTRGTESQPKGYLNQVLRRRVLVADIYFTRLRHEEKSPETIHHAVPQIKPSVAVVVSVYWELFIDWDFGSILNE